MDTKALRQKILDLAIRGKLVPQDPNDEPASVLLGRIRQQKQQMVKEGKLKPKDIKNDSVIFVGEDNLHYEKFADGSVKCIEDEIPFDLPDGWEWVRLGSVGDMTLGKMLDVTKNKGTLRPYLRNINVRWGAFELSDVLEMRFEDDELERYSIRHGDLVICEGGEPGRCAVWQSEEVVFYQKALHRVRAIEVLPEFLYYVIRHFIISNQYERYYTGTTIKHLTGQSLRIIPIPLPPLNEQKLIVEHLQRIIEEIDKIETEKTEALSLVSFAKSKILDLAIRGQLVPQDPDDEPASVLLERIRAEKEELIKQGKIKRNKKESIIFRGEDNSYYEKVGSDVICIDAEIPFEIPDTWEWMRLESCCIKEIRRGKSPKYIDESGTLVFAQKCNTKYSGIDVGLALFLDESVLGRYPDDEYMHDGDVVINSTGTGTLGRVGIYYATDNHLGLPIVPDSHVTVIRAAHSIQSIYVYAFMKANQSELEKEGEGSTNQKELKPFTLKEMLIPIPPYSEQERIVATIDAAFSTISSIEKSLN